MACGVEWGHREPGDGTTWHLGTCEVCGERAPVTHARDFGYLRDGWQLEYYRD
jgi:hypothetical protein